MKRFLFFIWVSLNLHSIVYAMDPNSVSNVFYGAENSSEMSSDAQGTTILDWQYANAHYVYIGSTPNTSASYNWYEESNRKQGVHISLISAQPADIYLQQGNGWINFHTFNNQIFQRCDVKYDNGSWSTIWSTSNNSTNATGWKVPSFINSPGQHSLSVKFWFVDGSSYTRTHTVFVVPVAQKLYFDNYGNRLTVWEGSPNGTPVLLSEGIDAYNTGNSERLRYAGKQLVDSLVARGAKVYILNYKFGGQSIKNNAAVLASAVQFISSINSNKNIVVSGMSMGGVIARYALAKAEASNTPLKASKFFSIDSPQQGAVLHYFFQIFVKQPTNCSATGTFGHYGISCDAAKELLTSNVFDANGTMHSSFYTELNSLNGDGYPHLTRNVGISFSNGSPNSSPSGSLWVKAKYTGIFGVDALCGTEDYMYLTNETAQAGSYLPKSITDYQGRQVFFGTFTLTRYANATFIPYNSAMDIVNGNSKFHATYQTSTNKYHDEFSSELVRPIIDEIYPIAPPGPLVVSIDGPSIVSSKGAIGTYTALASGGNGNYSYAWQNGYTTQSISIPISYCQYNIQVSVVSGQESVIATRIINYQGCSLPIEKTIPRGETAIPVSFELGQNYPNPFNPSTTIAYSVPFKANITMKLYDVMGREVATLANGTKEPGFYQVTFDASRLASGTYIYRLESPGFSSSKKLTLIK
ncbi:T9SS type A sorting domain-containing protein [bacterium]|nr:T9SS type A sorting domain-containing protein [bacterium]NUN45371.1 T9SS type A sorting domain-containing protein [bacterium]